MKRIWLAWLVFGLCAGAMLVIMGWGSRKLIEQEVTERKARQAAALEENVRLSLWRMETALAAVVVQENSRSYTAYSPGGSATGDRSGESISPYVKLHFQIDQNGGSVPASPPGIEALRSPAAVGALSAAIPRTWIHVELSARPRPATPIVAANVEKPSAKLPQSPSAPAQIVSQAEPLQPGVGGQQNTAFQSPAPQSQMARNYQEYEVRGLMNSNNAAVLRQAPSKKN